MLVVRSRVPRVILLGPVSRPTARPIYVLEDVSTGRGRVLRSSINGQRYVCVTVVAAADRASLRRRGAGACVS